ncbi:MAG: T9SS type A sorting domain-containing protein [Salibacteraceae bacterium]
MRTTAFITTALSLLLSSLLFSQNTEPGIEWRVSDWAMVKPYGNRYNTINQTNDESGEEWWNTMGKIYENGVHTGYITTGFATWRNQSWDEADNLINTGCGKYNVDLNTPDVHLLETPGVRKGFQRGTIARYDLNGIMIWCKPFQLNEMFDVVQTSDGGFLAVGLTKSTVDITSGSTETPLIYNPTSNSSTNNFANSTTCPTKQNYKGVAVKLSISGNVEWQYLYGLEDFVGNGLSAFEVSTEFTALAETTNGYVITGRSANLQTDPAGAFGAVLFVIDDLGYLKNKYVFNRGNANSQVGNRPSTISQKATSNTYAYGGMVVFVPDTVPWAYIAEVDYDPATFTISHNWTPSVKYIEPNNDMSSLSSLIYNTNGNIVAPIISNCTSCRGPGYNDGEGKIYELDPSNNGAATFKTSLGQVRAFDLKVGITQTADGGYAIVSSKENTNRQYTTIAQYDQQFGLDPGIVTYYSDPKHINDIKYWETDAYVAKLNSNYVKQWDKQFDSGGEIEAFPGDMKHQECLYTIVEADAGGFVICGNNSNNFDDYYLAKLTNNCSTQGISPTYLIDDYQANPTNYNTGIWTTITWDGFDRKVNGIVRIKKGVKFVVDGIKVEFTSMKDVDKVTGFYVEEGGRLEIINGAKITAIEACSNAMWGGITAFGLDYTFDANANNGFGNRGEVIITNSSIENAVVGVMLGKNNGNSLNYQCVWKQGGAILQATNAEFLNCYVGVQMAPTSYSYNNSQPINHKHDTWLKGCSFKSNSDLKDGRLQAMIEKPWLNKNQNFPVGIWMREINGVRVEACDFENTNNIHHGTGIKAETVRFWNVPTYNATGIPTNRSNFKNLHQGIFASAINPMATNEISFTNFINCNQGINLLNIDYAKVNYNSFESAPSGVNNNSSGLYLYNCAGYAVERNEFTKHASAVGSNYGVLVNNSNTANQFNSNEIRDNEFENLYLSATGMNENRGTDPSKGLDFRCNTFETNDYDVFATGTQGISESQGAFNQFDDESPAGNLFDGCTQVNGELANSTLNYQYFYHTYLGSGLTPELTTGCFPKGTGLAEVNDQLTGIPWNRISACPSHFNFGSTPVPSTNWWISKLETYTGNGQQADGTYNSLVDNDDTDGLLDLINSNAEESILDADLRAASPYLSDQVLISMLNDRPTTLSDEFIEDIVVANAPVTQAVYNALIQRSPQIGSETMTAINWVQQQPGLSEREELEQEKNWYWKQAGKARNRVISELLLDTISHPNDTLFKYLSQSPNEYQLAQMADFYLMQHNTNNAQQELDNLSGQYDWTDYITTRELIIGAIDAQMTYSELLGDENVYSVFETINDASSSPGYASTQSLLIANNNISPVYIYPAVPVQNQNSAAPQQETTSTTETLNQEQVLMAPNPASQTVTISFSGFSENRSLNLKVISLQGTEVLAKTSTSEKGFTLDVSDVSNGLYLLYVSDNNNATHVKKLLVQH